MKKTILSGLILLATSFSFSAFASSPYGTCTLSAPDASFCQCFETSCSNVFGAAQCNYNKFKTSITTYGHGSIQNGANAACMMQSRGESPATCVTGIYHYLEVCGSK